MSVPAIFTKYVDWISKCYSNWPDCDKMLFFRGHADADWNLIPSVLRTCKRGLERELILDYKQTNVNDMNYQSKIENMLVTMQHYGIPTRLLDWSMSPLVALFFACQPETSKESIHVKELNTELYSERHKNGKVFCLNPWETFRSISQKLPSRHPQIMDILKETRMMLAQGWDYAHIKNAVSKKYEYDLPAEALRVPVPFVGRYMVDRVKTQKGAFVIWGDGGISSFGYERDVKLDDFQEYKNNLYAPFVILANEKESLLSFLRKLGINNFSIFSDVEGMSRDIKTTNGIYNIN